MLHRRLYDIAKSDLRAANILTNKSLYPQAIYFYSQAFEKAAKSALALYLTSYENKSESEVSEKIKKYGHRLVSLNSKVVKIFLDNDKRLYVKQGGKESDEVIKKAYNSISISYLETLKPDKTELISKYEVSVRNCYALYTRLKEEPILRSERPEWKLLRELNMHKYLKYNNLARILFPILDGMDEYARYPKYDVRNLNIAFLSRSQMGRACSLLGEMMGDLASLVPLVWNKIESLKIS